MTGIWGKFAGNKRRATAEFRIIWKIALYGSPLLSLYTSISYLSSRPQGGISISLCEPRTQHPALPVRASISID
jgi:hypothetical protein